MKEITTKSLSEALRDRAEFIRAHPRSLEYGWGDDTNVIAALYEFADVVDSWSSEYLSKELTYKENQRRRWGTTHPLNQKPMTMEERIAAVKNVDYYCDQ